ncbi:hypothetical protein GQE99_04055 [Maritimibacter sp. DP07]|uniref:Uncharacterized protein n=1 Tax=Maritimibacter harenae TaxID=2606218 RepID=A0A845M7L1_9RHOB|nr:hypothetical protein [Maritimibacter harenae]MZR12191.1 hypothetical protein [Maritimibacter harenae]
MTDTDWELLERQGAREVWAKVGQTSDGAKTVQYKGKEHVEMPGERSKVDEVKVFDTETEALAWLNAGVG